jgi:two-component system, NarL family, sensor histidine kinase UhpB
MGKTKRSDELLITHKELSFQNEEKEKSSAELIIANKELAFQNNEKEKRAAELVIANKELSFQNKEKEKRAAELVIANKELAFQNEEKEKRAGELEESEKKYRDLVERVSDGFIALDLNWNFTYLNKKAEELFNKPPGYLLGKNIWTEFPEANGKAIDRAYHLALKTRRNLCLEEFSVMFNKWMETNFCPSATGISVYFKDITDKKIAEENLHAMEQKILNQKVEEQKKISRAIIKAQEQERNRLGQELHDNINQILAATKMYMTMAGDGNTKIKELIAYPLELLDNSIHEIRLLSSKQVTPLQNINLKELIQVLLDNLSEHTVIKPVFVYNVINEAIDDDLKLNIYRIIQEQINNIMKHADPKNVNVSVQANGKAITIAVSDDGRGFNTSNKRKGIGISNMINRIKSFNGDVAIKSSPGKGCAVQIKIPY